MFENLHTKKTSNGSNFGWLIQQMSINQKSGWQMFCRRFVSGSLFVSPCPPECYLQKETKIEPDLRLITRGLDQQKCKKGGQYSAILTRQAWSIKNLLYDQKENVYLRDQHLKSRVGKMGPSCWLGQPIRMQDLLYLACQWI